MKELKDLQDQTEANLYFLNKKQLSYIKAVIKLAYSIGRTEVSKENYERIKLN